MAKTVTVETSESESEHEMKTQSPAKASASKKQERVEVEEVEPEEEGSDEGEFEIEAILDARHGAFGGGRLGYLVKWKGYGEDQNSWVNEKDCGNAQGLIDEYWRKQKKEKKGRKSDIKAQAPATKGRKSSIQKEDSDIEMEPVVAKKRGRPSKAKADQSDEEEVPKVKKPRKSTGKATKAASDAMEEGDPEAPLVSMKKWEHSATWEHIVEKIETVEKAPDGLVVYFQLKGSHGRAKESSTICKQKMPQKLLEFYETNLRWRELDADAEE